MKLINEDDASIANQSKGTKKISDFSIVSVDKILKAHKQVEHKYKIVLNAVLVQDPIDNGYTGFFEQCPEAVAEGATEEEVARNLKKALEVMISFNKEL